MFLSTLIKRNRDFIDFIKASHENGEMQPDSFILDVDQILHNAVLIKEEADQYQIELFFMLKQIGRNPYIAKKLIEIGYKGAVVVDFREAEIMMDHGIPICHCGHLVQVPHSLLTKFIGYGIEYMTVYSIEKAREIDKVCSVLGKKQKILLKFIDSQCMIYPSQESGFHYNDIEYITEELLELNHIEIAGVTAFPAFLYNETTQEIEVTNNSIVLEKAAVYLEKHLQYKMHRNLPSCTQKSMMKKIHTLWGTQGEPGNSMTGTTPNNTNGGCEEIPAIAYLTEISHLYEGRSYCYGGGLYARGKAQKAIVFDNNKEQVVDVNMPNPENIDYYFSLEYKGTVSSTVIMSFRTQIFDTRSQVILVKGLLENAPKILGIYDSGGRLVGEQNA